MGYPEILKEIEARANAASAWTAEECEIKIDAEYGHVNARQGATIGDTLIMLDDTYEGSGDDWNFVAHSRADIPALLSTVCEALAKIAELEKDRERLKAHVQIGWVYKVIVNKHLTGTVKEGQIQINGRFW